MTGANRVSSLYASVAEAGDGPGDEPVPSKGAGSPERRPDTQRPAREVDGARDESAARAERLAKDSESGFPVAAKARGRSGPAARVASRQVLLRRAALAGIAIVLLGLGLIVVEANAPAPAAMNGPRDSTANAPAGSVAGAERAAPASISGTVASASEEGGAPGSTAVAVGPETEAPAASIDAATPAEAGQAGVPPGPNPLDPVHEGAPQGSTSQAVTTPAGDSHPGTPPSASAPSATAQPATVKTPQTSTEPSAPGGTSTSHSDVARPGSARESGTAAPVSELPLNAETPAAAASVVQPAPPSTSARALARGYVVQLGVFGDPDNAAMLGRELAAQGYPAHLQSRVVLGPFPDRQAAKAAAERLRRERKLEGIVVPPRNP